MASRPKQDGALPGTVWERRPPVSQDRSSTLSRDEIANAAFAVAEHENLGAVSVKRVAGRLGIPAPRLENYFADRGELLDLMVDVALGEVELDASIDSVDWQVQLWHVAHAIRTLVQRHEWLATLLGVRAATGPNGLRFTEHSLRAVVGRGVDVRAAASMVESVLTFVTGSVRPDKIAGAGSGRTTPEATATYLTERVSTGDYPLLVELFDRPTPDADDLFDTGLGYLLAGIAADLSATDTPRPIADARR